MSREVSASLSLSKTLAVVTEKCRELLHSRACVVLLQREEDRIYMGEGAAGVDATVVKTLAITPGQGALGHAIQEPRGFHVQAGPEGPADDDLTLLGAENAAGMPLMASGEPFGLLVAIGREGGFDPGALELLSLYASSASNAVRNAQLYEKIRELDRLKSEFVAVVSHELRTPLTSIRGSLELLGNPSYWEIKPQQKELLEICEANTERLLLLINDILDFSKLDANRMTLDVRDRKSVV